MGKSRGEGPRIEAALEHALARACGRSNGADDSCPPRLAAALRYAVFPGGARVRPRLCLGVAGACGDDRPDLTEAAAASIELLHCASLVHDDLPAFDDAATRRGKPSVHVAFGEPLAVLAGDALIVLAFEVLGGAIRSAPDRAAALVATVAAAVGAPNGIVAGQAFECEDDIDLARYHRAKTGALFVASAVAGAQAAGADPAPWCAFGTALGEAYQVADDLRDATASEAAIGKPVRRDGVLGRPSAVSMFGVEGAVEHLEGLLVQSIAAIPDCPGAGSLKAQMAVETRRFLPKGLARRAA